VEAFCSFPSSIDVAHHSDELCFFAPSHRRKEIIAGGIIHYIQSSKQLNFPVAVHIFIEQINVERNRAIYYLFLLTTFNRIHRSTDFKEYHRPTTQR
jgi:hypothetical protein